MSRGRAEGRGRVRAGLEWLAWNAAAAAALTLMIVILLCSLQWLDRVDPRREALVPAGAAGAAHRGGDTIEAPERVARAGGAGR